MNWWYAPARTEVLLQQAIPAIARQLPAWQAREVSGMQGPRAVGYLRASLRRPVYDYLDLLERLEPGLVAKRRQALFAEIRDRLIEHMLREKEACAALPLVAPSALDAGSAAVLPLPRKAA